MHPRNPFVTPPDLAALATIYSNIAPYVRPGPPGSQARYDWGDSKALVELCRVLLRHQFGIRWTQPPHTLCPTVPSRLNYLLWIEDLLALRVCGTNPARVLGVDIGTGASCIYPLLGVAHLGWQFIATEVDATSTSWARHNVDLNQWGEHIEVRQVPHGSSATVEDGMHDSGNAETATLLLHPSPPPILIGVLQPSERADFCMCNPPFFAPDETPQPNLTARPRARCVATHGEQFTSGGEVGFVLRLLAESTQLRTQIRWYTSLMGRKHSLWPILRALRGAGAAHVRTTEIAQGKTSRWAVAWSFAPDAAPRLQPPTQPAVKSFEAVGLTPEEAWRRVDECLRASGACEDVAANDDRDAVQDAALLERPFFVTRGRIELASGSDSRKTEGAATGAKRVRGDGISKVQCSARMPPSPPLVAPAVSHDGDAVEDALFVFRVELTAHPPLTTQPDETEPPSSGPWLRVELEASTTGQASAAFWRFAERLRNDVMRDTRKWRRRVGSCDDWAAALSIEGSE